MSATRQPGLAPKKLDAGGDRRRAPNVEVGSEHPRGEAQRRRLAIVARRMLEALGEARGVILLLTTDRGIRRLNRDFRGKDRATDVLSFPAAPPLPGEPASLGDLAISLDTGRRVAREARRPLAEELDRYLAHGLLHLLGWDHERSPREAAAMARREARLLGGEGMLGARPVRPRGRAKLSPRPRTR